MGKRLREARLRLNMTQSEVADEQFSVSYISAVERGQIRPSLGALEQLSERLDVPLSLLVAEDTVDMPISSGREAAAERRQEEADAKMRAAQVYLHQGQAHDALDTLRAINTNHLSAQSVMELRRLLAHVYVSLDQPEEARNEALEGIAGSERAGDEEMRARLRNELGSAYLLERKSQLALEQFRLAYEAIARGVGRDPAFRLEVLYNLGDAYLTLNQTSDAEGVLREAVEQSGELNNPEHLGKALWQLSASYANQGDARRAKSYAQRALLAFEQADNRRLTARAYTRLGRATAQSNISEALELLQQAQTMTEREGDARGQAEVQRSLAAVYVSQKRNKEAHEAAQKALNLAQSVADDILRAESLLAMAQVQDAQGQEKQAEANFEQAIELFEKADARQHLGDAYAAFSKFLEARGKSQRALEVLRQAWNIREGAPA
jgi:tetratricopeptide (TPR) repeat protein